ncbi:DUF1588 domain-containing protein [Thalassoroseus pseudoceratinae]|uniref:DUF1588 domain-containing protein n=1 Tax=Thalassoroseus pseudoceratinae TaxID=2713176 RepID=UPI0014230A32|nr:DUF1588 domain-containing protein [Thalassoroseus pseudoceratinae]
MSYSHNLRWLVSLGAILCGTTVFATETPKSELGTFVAEHCVVCHNAELLMGKLNLQHVAENPSAADSVLLQRLHEVVANQEMPPVDEPQPSEKVRASFLAKLTATLKTRSDAENKLLEPGWGNLVDHQALFTEPDVRRAATPARLWRLSPHIFMQRANDVSRMRMLVVRPNQGGDGLHPAFAYMTPPHAFRDNAATHAFEAATTELLFNVCWEIAGFQTLPDSPRLNPHVRRFRNKTERSDRDWRQLISMQLRLALRRNPQKDETEGLLALARKTEKQAGLDAALQSVFTAVLLKPEAVYRFEVGDGKPDEFGRVFLSPYELKHAIAYALTDHVPDAKLDKAATSGNLATRADVRREVERLLADFETTSPRLLRFFQEYFEYPKARAVFKDRRRANAIFARERLEDADEFVLNILEDDQQVLRRLLTEDTLFVVSKGLQRMNAPTERRFRRDLLPDYGFPSNWEWEKQQPLKPKIGRRSGMLTHPAWLLAFSDNEKNQAIQRGRWVQMKLLGGTVPDTPIGVDAKLPTDPHLTLREKMKQVTSAGYCWNCHQKMDPLGLPFEQFDDFGRWREEELDRPVDTTGMVTVGVPEVDGPVSDPFEMMERFAASQHVEQVFVRHVFRYFLGRNETLDDAPTLIDAHRAYREHGGSFKALVTSLLTSDSFLYRRVTVSPETAAATNERS